MPGNTTFRGYTYPVLSDAANVPFYVQQGFTQIDTDVNAVRHPPIGVFHKTALVSIAHEAYSSLTWPWEDLDLPTGQAAHDPSGTRYTVKTAGYYEAHASICWAGNATGYREIAFRQSNAGGALCWMNHEANMPAADHYMHTGGILPLVMAIGDYIEVFVKQSSGGGALNCGGNATYGPAYFSVKWLGAP